MEFPDLGKHCEEKTCKQLDFLPFQCDACNKTFCLEHRTYTAHNCPNHKLKDNQVTVCPLCQHPVSVNKNEEINDAVERHIMGGCVSEQAQRLNKNRCMMKGCKASELIPFVCKSCNQQYCIRHRTIYDHKCSVLNRNKETTRTIGPFRIPVKVQH